MQTPKLNDERGIAMVLSVFGVVVIAALVAGAFWVGRTEQLTGYNEVWAGQAGQAADAGIAHATVVATAPEYEALPVWTPAAPVELDLGVQPVPGLPGVVFVDSVRRLNDNLYLVRSIGRRVTPSGRVLAEQSLTQLMRIARPTIGVNAAVTVQDPIKFNGNSFAVDGINGNPPQWGFGECDPIDAGNTDDVVGIRSSTTTGAAAKDMDNIFGFPAPTVDYDPTITSSTFQNFLDYTYVTLSAQPGVKILPLDTPYNGVAPVIDATQSPAVCDKNAPLNFGEPFRNPPTLTAVSQCYDYFPVVHGTGGTTKFAAGNRGQGILLVDGDLELVGGFEWSGLVIVRGDMTITGTGNKIYGAILTEGAEVLSAGAVSGDIEVHYSSCAIARAVNGAAQPYPLSRGWAQTF